MYVCNVCTQCRNGGKVLLTSLAGQLVRSKPAGHDEGGNPTGAGALDSIIRQHRYTINLSSH